MKAVVKVDIVDGKCVVIYSDGSEQELYDVNDDTGGSGEAVLGTKNITSNGSYTARSDGYDGYSKVNVNVPTGSADLGTKNIVTNGTYNASSDNLDGYSSVNVNVPTGITPTGTKQITISENGTTTEDVTNYANAEITVNVPSAGYSVDDIANGSTIDGHINITGTYIRNYAFCSTKITSVSAPNLVDGGAGRYFDSCTNLVNASLPKFAVTSAIKGSNIFNGCSNLETVDAPLIRLNGNQFDGCSKLKKYVNKNPTNFSLGSYEFRNCSSLEILDMNNIGQFGTGQGWNNTPKLSTIIIRKSDNIAALNNDNSVPTSMKSGGIGCTIYVPSALKSTYESATNWSTLVASGLLTFEAIEGSYYETHYGDSTLIA